MNINIRLQKYITLYYRGKNDYGASALAICFEDSTYTTYNTASCIHTVYGIDTPAKNRKALKEMKIDLDASGFTEISQNEFYKNYSK